MPSSWTFSGQNNFQNSGTNSYGWQGQNKWVCGEQGVRAFSLQFMDLEDFKGNYHLPNGCALSTVTVSPCPKLCE